MSTMIDCNTGNIRCEHIQGSNLTAVYTTNKNGGTKVWIWDSSSKKYTAKGNLTSQDTHNVMYDKEHYTMRIENGKVFVSQYKQDEPHINTTPSGTSYVANINGKKVTALVVGGLVIGLVAVGVLIWLKNPIAAGNAAVGTGEIIGGTEGATVIKHILDRIASILFPLLLIPEELQAKEAFSQANQAGIPGADPILVDLNGDGVIGTTSVRDGVYFDHQVDGFAESSAWVDENDGILVIDKNNNGVIDNGGEVFGDNYVKEDGSKASSGFDALADLDSNNDGVISIEDESFGLIKILKGDGELIGLEEAGIVSINLNTNSVNEVDENGNTLVSSGSFVREDGSIGSLGDFNLVVDKMDSFAVEWVDESEEVSKLPDVMGLGMVYSLHQAMMRDESGVLKGLVEEFIKVEGEVRKKEILKDILYKWTGADDVLVSDGGYHYDGKKLWVIEKFVGEEFKGINNDGHPNIWAAPLLDDVYNKIIEYVYYQLMIQCDGMIKNIYNMLELEYDFESNEVRYNFDKVIGYIDNELVKDEAMGIGKLLEATQIFKALGIDKQEGYERYFEHFNSLKEEYGGLLNAIGKNVINGTDEDDNIEGTGGADAVFAGDGNDIIYTRQGDDLVYGGGGDDVIDVCEGNDVVYGGDGNDSIIAGDGNDTVYGESGNDTINAGKGNDVVYGGDGNDSILGGEGNDLIYGEDGDDYINPGNGNNTVYGGNGNDTIKVSSTGNGSSYFDGGDGNDRIETMDGSNTVIGGKGDDYLYSGNRSDIRYYYGGHETFIYNLGDGNDTIENWRGNDVIEFGEGISLDNILFSGEGNDLIVRFKDNEGSIRIKYALSDSLYRVESFRFNDGSVLSYDEVLKIKNTQDKIVSIETKYIETKTNADLMEGLDKIDDSIGLTISDSDINKIIQDMTAYNTAEDGMISYGEDVNKEKELMMLVNS